MQSAGLEDVEWASRFRDLAWHAMLPGLALALPVAAMIERLQAQAMADALREPCILAASARGISARRLIWRHALKLSVKPVAAVYGIIVGTLLSGSFAVESSFRGRDSAA